MPVSRAKILRNDRSDMPAAAAAPAWPAATARPSAHSAPVKRANFIVIPFVRKDPR